MTKLIKRVKDYSHRERLEKLGLTILLDWRMKGNLIETFKIMEFLIVVDEKLFATAELCDIIELLRQKLMKNWLIPF